MSYIKYLPKPLLEDIINNNCIPIIGAGFSLNAELPKGKTMPKWDDLGEAFAKELGGYAYNHRVCQEFCVNSVMPKFGAGLDMEPPAGMISRDWAMLESGHHVANQPIMPTPPCKVL